MYDCRRLPIVVLGFLLAVTTAQAGESKTRCNASAQECERAIRQMLSGRRYLGVQVMELNPGLAVKAIVPDGPAASADIRPGDRLMAVNGHSMKYASIKDFKKILSQAKETGILWVIVERRGILKHLDVRMEPYSAAQIEKIIAQHLAEFHGSPATASTQQHR